MKHNTVVEIRLFCEEEFSDFCHFLSIIFIFIEFVRD